MPLKFAIVREDPQIELAIAAHIQARQALLVASGGCTALAFTAATDVQLTLYDFNPAQLHHVERRRQAVLEGDVHRHTDAGDFEALFRLFATGFRDLIADPEPWFRTGDGDPEVWMQSPYWPALFQSTFHDGLLVAMFGPDAVQHAPANSYPAYFRTVFERGLRRPDARSNPFLQHIFLGHWLQPLPAAAPPEPYPSVLGGVPDVPHLERFQLVHLSNIFDWADDTLVARWSQALLALEPGAAITVRQLNNRRPLELPGFRFDRPLADTLLQADRSLFYERLHVGFRT